MKKKQVLALAFIGTCVLNMDAASTNLGKDTSVMVSAETPESVPLQVVQNKDSGEKGNSYMKTLVPIPEVTKDDHTLHFITPCTGLTLQLVQDDEVCYETVITSDYLEIPSDITGVYELQILRGNYVFYAEIEL